MRKLTALFVLALLKWPVAAAAEDDVMSVDAAPDGSDYLWLITVTSRVDALDVANVDVNRGNCKTQAIGRDVPRMLKFGESFRFRALFCHPLEVVVDVNGKGQLYNFGPEIKPGNDIHVDAEVYGGMGYQNTLTVTNVGANDMTLSRVTINRGACGPFGDVALNPPKVLRFGEYYTVRSFPCRPVEVTAQTSKGPMTVKLD